MCIILLETTDSGETRESTVDFISVEDSEVSVSEREISVGSLDGVEHETMSGTIHGLESVFFVVIFEKEHVLLVLCPMSGDLPKLCIEEIGSNDLIVTSDSVLSTESFDQFVIDMGTVGVEESTPG